MTDADLIAQFIATRGVTVCPPRTFSPEPEPRCWGWRVQTRSADKTKTPPRSGGSCARVLERRAKIRGMLEQGMSYREIGAALGVSGAAICKDIKRARGQL